MKYDTAISSVSQLSLLDFFAFAAVLWTLMKALAKRSFPKNFDAPKYHLHSQSRESSSEASNTRDICRRLEQSHKNCVVFYGSQTGTAEKLALRLAKEGSARFGLKTMVADLDDFEYDNLDAFSANHVAMFVIATYGEGEPTDNAIAFHKFITNPQINFKTKTTQTPLSCLKFAAFGLGNSNYQHYNVMVKTINRVFNKLGANRIGNVGKGDDGKGTLEEDFLAWKEKMWQALTAEMSLQEQQKKFEPAFTVSENETMAMESAEVYLGEPNKKHLKGRFKGSTRSAHGPFSSQNPYLATITESKELFRSTDRNCLHMEVDIGGSTLAYDTGDHLAVLPMNPNDEVDRFLDIFDLSRKRDMVISIHSNDTSLRVPFPSTTTYETAVRYYLDICAPVSRMFFSALVEFLDDETLKTNLLKLSEDKIAFQDKITHPQLNIAQALQVYAGPTLRISVPFSLFVENLNKLQCRYYSISSSARAQPDKISITAVVESQRCGDTSYTLKGVCTNYLLALHQHRNGSPSTTYQISGPRHRYEGTKLLVHIRSSKFRLPMDPQTPIIMIGPGTGVAPFRAFVQERASLVSAGTQVGRTLLFFGCRRSTEDFIYESEWKDHKNTLGDKFDIVSAFSREGASKCYVQNKLAEHAKEVAEILHTGGHVYVCGDARSMARDVNLVLCDTVGADLIKQMRGDGRYQEDVWA